MDRAPARFALVVDIAGQSVAHEGNTETDDMAALGALVAGDLLASLEIARMTGEYQKLQMVIREGEQSHSFIMESGFHLVLFVQVPSKLPLGWARVTIQEAAQKLEGIMAAAPEAADNPSFNDQPELIVDQFGSALEELWAG